MKAQIQSTHVLWIFIFLLFYWETNFIQSFAEETEIVYCIGNRDATGSCWKASSNQQDKLSCLISSWPIVECESLEEQSLNSKKYGCLALQNTGIVNQISLSCQAIKDGSINSESISAATIDDSADQSSDLDSEGDEAMNSPAPEESKLGKGSNAFMPDLDPTRFGVEQPVNFEEAF